MKKIALLLSLSFLAFSCSDDDDSGSNSDLIGTWTWTESYEELEGEIVYEHDLDECDMMDSFVFSSNSVKITTYASTSEGCVLDYDESTSYSTAGNLITFDGGESVEYVINGSELRFIEEDSYDGNDDGKEELYHVIDVYTKSE